MTLSSCSLARWENTAFEIAMNGTSYGTVEDRKAEPVRLADERLGNLVVAEAEPEAERGDTPLGEPAKVRLLTSGARPHPQTGRQKELAAAHPRRGIGELGGVQPADLPAEPFRTRGRVEPESRHRHNVLNREHLRARDCTGCRIPLVRIRAVTENTYEQSGVSLAKAEAMVERLAAAVGSTRTDAVVGGLGGFAGLYALDDTRLLAASTDGVGTKIVLQRGAGRLGWAGADLAAHCINDVLTTGADPLFFLDYVAAHRLELADVAELVEGAASVCRQAGCAILGGESAEMPGVYRDGELDFAGTCVGLVTRERLIDGSRVEAGDAVLGFPHRGSMRTASRSSGACSGTARSTRSCCFAPRASTSTTFASFASAATSGRSPTSRAAGFRGTSRECCPRASER